MSEKQFRLTADGRVYFKGSRTYANRDHYEGEFVDNMRHGMGVLRFYKTGDRYEGEFKANFFDGYGIYV